MQSYCCPAPDHGEPSIPPQQLAHPLLASPLSFLRRLAADPEEECADACEEAVPCDGLIEHDEGQEVDCCFDLGCPETIVCSSPECDIPSCPTLDICTDADCTLPIAPPLPACKDCGQIPRPPSTSSSSVASSLSPLEPNPKRVTHVQPNGDVLECSCSHHTSWDVGPGQLTDQDFDDFLECCNAHLGPFPAIPLETPTPSLDFANSASTSSSLSPSESPNPNINPASAYLPTSDTASDKPSGSSTSLDALLNAALASFSLPSAATLTLGSQSPYVYQNNSEASHNQFLSSLFPIPSGPSQHASASQNETYNFNSTPFQQQQHTPVSATSSSFSPSAHSFDATSPAYSSATSPSSFGVQPTPSVPCEWNDCEETFPTIEQLIEHFRSSSSHLPLPPQQIQQDHQQQQQQSYGYGSMQTNGGGQQQPALECYWGGEQHSLDWSMSDGTGEGGTGPSNSSASLTAGLNLGSSPKDLLLKHLLEDHLGRLQQQQQQPQQQFSSRAQLHAPQRCHQQQQFFPSSQTNSSNNSFPTNLLNNLEPNLFNLQHQQFHQQSTLYPHHDPSTCTFDLSSFPQQPTISAPPFPSNPNHHHHYGTVHQTDHTHSHHDHSHDHPRNHQHDHFPHSHAQLPPISTSSPLPPPPTKPVAPPKPSSRASFASSASGSSAVAQTHACGYPNCSETFPNTDALTKHLDSVHVGSGKDSYSCGWEGCERGINGPIFKSKQKIMRHLQSHTGHKPFICTICSQSFSEAATLQQHHRRHTNEKPFACDHPGCTKTFSLAASLTIHKRTHDGLKPFQCPHCTKAFVEASNLTKHIRTHTGERPFPCTYYGCDKRFARPDQLARHRGVHERKEAKDAANGGSGGGEASGSG